MVDVNEPNRHIWLKIVNVLFLFTRNLIAYIDKSILTRLYGTRMSRGLQALQADIQPLLMTFRGLVAAGATKRISSALCRQLIVTSWRAAKA